MKFQLTASRRGWPAERLVELRAKVFQLTASRRGWRWCFTVRRWLNGISTHSLTKRLTYFKNATANIYKISTHSLTKRLTSCRRKPTFLRLLFQLTASRRGWLTATQTAVDPIVFQLTASRRGWRRENYILDIELDISTHSLTKRLTKGTYSGTWFYGISTHSLTKRLTAILRAHIAIRSFQLTASRRGWQISRITSRILFSISTHSLTKRLTYSPHSTEWYADISTHSLTKRLTMRQGFRPAPFLYFNSQPHEEADRKL